MTLGYRRFLLNMKLCEAEMQELQRLDKALVFKKGNRTLSDAKFGSESRSWFGTDNCTIQMICLIAYLKFSPGQAELQLYRIAVVSLRNIYCVRLFSELDVHRLYFIKRHSKTLDIRLRALTNLRHHGLHGTYQCDYYRWWFSGMSTMKPAPRQFADKL